MYGAVGGGYLSSSLSRLVAVYNMVIVWYLYYYVIYIKETTLLRGV